MRPLTHLGEGRSSPDYDLYKLDETLYDELHERTNTLIEAAYKEFMGEYYEEPLPTKNDLKESLEKTLNDKNHLIKMRAPQSLIDSYDENIVEIYNLINDKKYSIKSDPLYKSYYKKRTTRKKEWYDSKELKMLLENIQKYNEEKYNDLKRNLIKNEN
jgi:hypothetical protein